MPADLAAARRGAGLSQQALAEMVGVGRVHLAKIEAHQHVPRVSLALRLADALDVAVEDIFDWARER